jgi:hypothetical protein
MVILWLYDKEDLQDSFMQEKTGEKGVNILRFCYFIYYGFPHRFNFWEHLLFLEQFLGI